MARTQIKRSQVEQSLTWQGACKVLEDRIFKIRSPRGHGTGFYIGEFGTRGNLLAIATAYHVVQGAHDWGEPIKVVHQQTGKEYLLNQVDRAIFTFPQDLAIILFSKPSDFTVSSLEISLMPASFHLVPGVEVGWCGFPGVRSDKLCFFHGYISCYTEQDRNYLIDGVAINGVSGGPVFYINNETDFPEIVGVITAYIANRATGETLPGLSMVTSVAHYEETIKGLKNLNQAKKEADEQNPPSPNPSPEIPAKE